MILNVVSEKTLESHLDCKEIKPDNPKGNQLWMFTGRTDAEAETPILWPPDAKKRLIWRDPDAGKDWRQEEKGMTEDEMVGWHHWLDGREFEQAAGVGNGQGGLVCCRPWGRKESDTTERLKWTFKEIRHWQYKERMGNYWNWAGRLKQNIANRIFGNENIIFEFKSAGVGLSNILWWLEFNISELEHNCQEITRV